MAKPADTAAPETLAPEAKPADTASADAKPADAGSADAGSADAKPADAKPADGQAPPAATSSSGGKKKRLRRRRRRKKKGGDEAAQGSSAGEQAAPAPSNAGAASSGGRKKPRKEPERPAFNVGDEIFGRVSAVTDEALVLDVAGGKASGIYDRAELIQVPPNEGEQFIAKVKSFSTRGGMLRLGRELWDAAASRERVREALTTAEPLEGWVTGVIKGGLEVDFDGVRAFAPASHVSVDTGADLTPMLAKKFDFVVTHYAKKGRDVVVSRKQMIEAEHTAQRSEQLEKLKPEQRVKGIVRNVVQWGAFVALPEFGDIEGVVHMSEASHNRGARLNQVFKPGQEVEVEVLRVDEKGKLWLSRKATLDDPWAAAPEKYAVGTILTGKVVRLTDFGAFVQLEPGIDGLCHVADLSSTHVEHPKEVVSEGQDLEVVIAQLDTKNRKVTLHPAPPEDERELPRIGRLSNHQKVQVVVTQIKDAGLGVRILGATGRRSRGFIPAGQTGTTRGTDLRKKFPLGTKLDVKVIDADSRRGEARLSIRALKEDAEKQAYRDYRKKVQRESGFGTFGDLLKDKLGG